MQACARYLCLLCLFALSLAQAQWEEASSPPLWGYPMCMINDGADLFAGMTAGVFLSTDHGTTWKPVNKGLPIPDMMRGPDIRSLARLGSDLFAGTWADGVYRSTNKGADWAKANVGLPSNTAIFSLVAAGPNLVAGTHSWNGISKGIYVSSDSGGSWIQSNNGVPSSEVYTLAAHGSTLFAGTLHGVFRSANSGKNWSLVPGLNSSNVSAIDNGMTVGTDYGIFVSTDEGLTWSGLGKWGLPLDAGSPRVIGSGKALFAGFDGRGVFMSTDNGATWSNISEGLTIDDEFNFLATDGTNLFAGLFFSGLWRRPLAQMVTSSPGAIEATPREFALLQNYPNPFNPGTVVSSQLPVASHVKLVVYDLLGREVAVLVNERRAAGTYRDLFDGSGLASGTYLYRLTAGSFVDTKRFILVK